ncbi:ABC transporter ATP-binding protein [Kribbella catacumbae]|uniref:ABC transporter ATP-binding protein n=1 Tax=Kribbella catacumbae TaxID=460086 RepID=UPI000362E0C9|nr:ABC transporter ATP-binding protein [Kribbella catacumbae]
MGLAAPSTPRRIAAGLRGAASLIALSWRIGPLLSLGLVVTAIVSGLLPASVAWLTKIVLDVVADQQEATSLAWLAAGLAAAGLALAVMPHISAYWQAELTRRTDRHLQERLYKAVTSFSGLSRFESPEFLDRLRVATTATGGALSPVTTGTFDMARSLITVASLLTALSLISPVMAIILVGAALPALAAQISLSRRHLGVMFELSPENRRHIFYTSLITDARAAKEVRLLDLGGFLGGRLLDALRRIQVGERLMDRRVMLVQAALALLGALLSGAGLIWVVRSAASGQMSVGDISAFIVAVSGTQAALAALVGGIAAANQALLTFDQHTAITTLPDDLPSATLEARLPPLHHQIELRGVWFRYDDAQSWILRGVSLTIPAGRSVALVGLNGAGKSTLIKLLCRFYDPTRGAILWDGIDIRDVPVADLRRRMGVLFQDYMNYDLTAAENIGVGDLPALLDRSRIEVAARTAEIHEQLQAMRRGYDTLLSRLFATESDEGTSEVGAALSGGQWQRLAFARTLMRSDRDLLILDEPTAGLDAESEYRLHRRLNEYRAGRTSVLVSHRLGAVRQADAIVVLTDGRVAELGTHLELLRAGGLYARLFTLQAQGYEGPGVGDLPEQVQELSLTQPLATVDKTLATGGSGFPRDPHSDLEGRSAVPGISFTKGRA